MSPESSATLPFHWVASATARLRWKCLLVDTVTDPHGTDHHNLHEEIVEAIHPSLITHCLEAEQCSLFTACMSIDGQCYFTEWAVEPPKLEEMHGWFRVDCGKQGIVDLNTAHLKSIKYTEVPLVWKSPTAAARRED